MVRIGRLVEPEYVANLELLLASEESRIRTKPAILALRERLHQFYRVARQFVELALPHFVRPFWIGQHSSADCNEIELPTVKALCGL